MYRRQPFVFAPGLQAIVAIAATAAASTLAYGHGENHHAASLKPTQEEIAAFETARPAFEHHCFRCHTTTGNKSKRKAVAHISMDTYPFGGHHAAEAGAAVRQVLGADRRSKATMPSDDMGAVTGDDLATIIAWANAFDLRRPSKASSPLPKDRSHER